MSCRLLPAIVLAVAGLTLCPCPCHSSGNLCSTVGSGYANESAAVVLVDNDRSLSPGRCVDHDTENTTTCDSLQSALQFVVKKARSSQTCIQLPGGTHLLTAPVVLNSSVVLIGDDGDLPTVITCVFTRASLSSSILHSLYFNRSQSVGFVNIHATHCPLPVRVDRVSNVHIKDSMFRYFSEAVFDIYNPEHLLISNCSFGDNRGTGVIEEKYRGNTGALAVGFYKMDDGLNNPTVEVRDSNFTSNSASNFRSSNDALGEGILVGRGGGMGVWMGEVRYNITVMITGCLFERNIARAYGGGLYLLHHGNPSHHSGVVEHTQFVSNRANLGAGALACIGLGALVNFHHTTDVRDCVIRDNHGDAGGGIYFSMNEGGRTNLLIVERTQFIGNRAINDESGFGAALATDVLQDFHGQESFNVHLFTDCTFSNNNGKNGIVSVGNVPVNFTGTNQFIGNTGSSLRVIGTRVTLGGVVEFVNNSALDGGALYLLSFAQIRLRRSLQLIFNGNQGRYGASVVVQLGLQAAVFSSVAYNPQCFLQLEEDSQLPPSNWNETNINVTFTGNRALFGSAVFASSLSSCSWYSTRYPYINVSQFPYWPIFNTRNDNKNVGYEKPFNQQHSFVTDAVDILVNFSEPTGWPGERLHFTAQGTSQLGHPTGFLTQFIFNPNTLSECMAGDIDLVPSTFVALNQTLSSVLTFHFSESLCGRGIEAATNSTLGAITVRFISYSLHSQMDSPIQFPIREASCPAGYTLVDVSDQSSFLKCGCEQQVEQVISCESDQDSIIIESGQWVVHVPTIDGGPNVQFYSCPPGYCQCFLNTSVGTSRCASMYRNSDPDQQCVCDRKGYLCGECGNGRGVSALLNNCVTCSDAFSLLIPILVIGDVLAMLVILLTRLRLPEWLYPSLFYIQVAPIVTLHFPVTFSLIGNPLYYIGSALSFYFPYDFCLYSNMTPLVSYTIRFIPLLVATITCLSVIFVRYYWKRIKMTTFSPWQGVWSIIVLLYSSVTYTCVTILNCPLLPDSNGFITSHWYVSGETLCFTGGHVPLALLSISVLLVCIMAAVLCSVIGYKAPSDPSWLRKFGTAIRKPYRDGLGWWSGVELGRRAVLLIFVTALPGNTFIASLIVMLMLTIYGHLMPYKNTAANWMEVVILIDFLVLLLFRSNPILQELLSAFPESVNATRLPQSSSLITCFTAMLTPLFYLPVVIGLVACAVWLAHLVVVRIRTKRRSRMEAINRCVINEENDERVFELGYSSFITNERRCFSVTEVMLEDSNDKLLS